MRRSIPPLALRVLLVLTVWTTPIAAQTASDRIRGVVSDESGGVLPGVTVVATSDDGRVAATVTDGAGRYVFNGLPAAPIKLTFELEGFSTTTFDLASSRDADAWLAHRLLLAGTSETVVVTAPAPVDAPAARPFVPAPPEPARMVMPVPEHDRDSICGPAKPGAQDEVVGTIRSRGRGATNDLYVKDDELAIDGGTLNGLEVGRNLVVRRAYRVRGSEGTTTAEHTAGVVQIVTAEERASVAVVVYACDELMRGDWLAPFTPEPVRTAEPPGSPAYDNAATILFADLGETLGAPGRLMVVDRGSKDGFEVGQRLTLFRRPPSRRGPRVVGDAVVVAVRGDSATMRVDHAVDVISPGDGAAPQRSIASVATRARVRPPG